LEIVATSFEELKVLKLAELICDEVWREVSTWDDFARETVGGQLARAVDTIGANIAEAYGRFHYGDKINFLYFARGSLFETKYWLNRCVARELMSPTKIQEHVFKLTEVARQLNAFASNLKTQRKDSTDANRQLRESAGDYDTGASGDPIIFTDSELVEL
jgi:four helix bundle protein